MSAININRIKKHLKTTFEGKIDVSDCREQEKECKFYSRALAALAIFHMCPCTEEEAAASVVDDYDDGGIDAIFWDNKSQRVYFVQSEFHEGGQKTVELGKVLKFQKGFDQIIGQNNFDGLNAKIRARESELKQIATDTNCRFILCVIHTGANKMHDTVRGAIEDFMKSANDVTDDMVTLCEYNQSQVYNIAIGAQQKSEIDLRIDLLHWGFVDEPYRAYYGQIPLVEILAWKANGSSLFDRNIRRILRESEVNDKIRTTLKKEPDKFWYFNNGITILCESISKEPIGLSRKDSATFKCCGVAVVNGAQTVGAIWDIDKEGPAAVAQLNGATVHVRLIDLSGCPNEFYTKVTRNTNTQNEIRGRDFASLDPNQSRLATELRAEGITYVFKTGDDTPPGRLRIRYQRCYCGNCMCLWRY